MCIAVTVSALSLAVLSSACGREQIQEQIGEQPSSAELVRSAEQGDASAQVSLGAMYADGLGVPQDGAAAVAWYCRAAEQGHASAQVSLGALYSDGGSGVSQNLVEGHTWLNLGASRLTGEQREEAVTARDRVAERMTPADLSEAQHRAREWNAAHQVGVDIAPGTYGTSGLTAGMSLCSDARLSLYLEHALSVEDLTTGWLDVGLDDDGRNKLVPTISFRLTNVSSEQMRTLQLNSVFRRCVVSDESLRFPLPGFPVPPGYLGRDPYPATGICDGEAQEWGERLHTRCWAGGTGAWSLDTAVHTAVGSRLHRGTASTDTAASTVRRRQGRTVREAGCGTVGETRRAPDREAAADAVAESYRERRRPNSLNQATSAC